MKKLILTIAAIFILTITAALLFTYFKVFRTKPLTQQELTLLTPDWSKITHNNWSPWHTLTDGTKKWNPAASYNTWIDSIPNEDKAWPILANAWYANMDYMLELEYGFFPEEDLLWEVHEDEYQSKRFRAIADQYVTASNKPHMGGGIYDQTNPVEQAAYINNGIKEENWKPDKPNSPNPLLMHAQYSYLGQSRGGASILQTAAASALLNNNPDEYIRYTMAIINLASLTTEFPTTIHQLVQLAILTKATQVIRWGLMNNPDSFTPQQLNQLDRSLAQYENLHYEWQGEALQAHDFLRRIAGPDGELTMYEHALQIADQQGYTVEATPANHPDLQLGRSIQQALLLQNKLNEAASENSEVLFINISINPQDIFEEYESRLNSVTRPFIEDLPLHLGRITITFRRINQQLRATRIAIALHTYHNTHNQYPDSLNQLNLPEHMLLDEFTSKQLHYKQTDTLPILYSTGQNKTDNNATQRFRTNHHGGPDDNAPYTTPEPPFYSNTSPADWILYPIPFGTPRQLYIPEENLP